jgi:hypothetical protein
MIKRSHFFAMSDFGDNSVTAVTIGQDCHHSLPPSRARMCVIKNLTSTRIESSSKSVTNSHHIVTMSLSHIRESDMVTRMTDGIWFNSFWRQESCENLAANETPSEHP